MIEREKLLDWNPDIIFIDEGNFDLVKQDYQKNTDFYKSLKAVKMTMYMEFYLTTITLQILTQLW